MNNISYTIYINPLMNIITKQKNTIHIKTLTFFEAFSSTLHLTLSNFVSYSLAPPRIARMNDGGMPAAALLLRRLPAVHAVVPLRLDITARDTKQFLMVVVDDRVG